MSDATPANKFAAIMWGLFTEGVSIDGSDLEEALITSGMAERKPVTAEEIAGCFCGEYMEPGDELTVLTEAGAAAVRAGTEA